MRAPALLLAALAFAGAAGAAPSGASSSAAAPAAAAAAKVDLNRASLDELCTLPGIGRKKAEAILARRDRRPFTRVTQLLEVKGIGRRTFERLKPLVVVSPVDGEPAGAPAAGG